MLDTLSDNVIYVEDAAPYFDPSSDTLIIFSAEMEMNGVTLTDYFYFDFDGNYIYHESADFSSIRDGYGDKDGDEDGGRGMRLRDGHMDIDAEALVF